MALEWLSSFRFDWLPIGQNIQPPLLKAAASHVPSWDSYLCILVHALVVDYAPFLRMLLIMNGLSFLVFVSRFQSSAHKWTCNRFHVGAEKGRHYAFISIILVFCQMLAKRDGEEEQRPPASCSCDVKQQEGVAQRGEKEGAALLQ